MIAKKRLLPILVAVLMVFAMMPMTAGTVFAEADPDTQAPVINLDNFTLSLPDGKDKATVGDTITATAEVTDDRYVKYVHINLHSPVTGASKRIDLEYTGTDETRSGIWTGAYTITDEDENGVWKIERISTHDGQNEGVYSNNKVYSWGNADLSSYDFEVISPECPPDFTTEGYSMMLDGAGATSTFGGNYYVNTADETVTPTVKVRFDAEDGSWTTLSPRKYTIKYEKKTGNDKKTYTLVSAKKGSKSFKKYFKVNKTTGKVTIKKNNKMKKGTYKVKVKVKAAGNANYEASAWKTVTFKVKIK